MKPTIDDFPKEKKQKSINDLVSAFVTSGNRLSARRTVWQEAKKRMTLILNEIVRAFQINWTVTSNEDNVTLWFPLSSLGTTTRPLTLKSGSLIYSQLVNGFIQVTMIWPYPDESPASARKEVIHVYDPMEFIGSVDEVIQNHVKRFLEELTLWNDLNPGPLEI